MLLLCRVLDFVGSCALCAFCAHFIGIDFHVLFVAYPNPNEKGHNPQRHRHKPKRAHKLNESGEESRGNFSKFTYVCGHFFIYGYFECMVSSYFDMVWDLNAPACIRNEM